MQTLSPSFKDYFALPLLVVMITGIVVSCMTTKVVKHTSQEEIRVDIQDPSQEKIFMLHQGANVWKIENLIIEEEKLFGILAKVSEEYLHRKNQINHTKNFVLKNVKVSLREVHIFLDQSFMDLVTGQKMEIEFKDIVEVRLYERKNHAAKFLAIIAGTAAVLFLVALATKESCPFIYTWDGNDYHLEGEIFGGAIFQPLERKDYLPLQYLEADQGKYNIVVTNELKEIQYINQLQLMVVNAAEKTTVLLDKYGHPFTMSQSVFPVSCTDNTGVDVSEKLMDVDDYTYNFEDADANLNHLYLNFSGPKTKDQMKLVLRARSSFWVDYLWREYTRFYAHDYATYVDERNHAPKEMMMDWTKKAGLLLDISVKVEDEWVPVQSLDHTGPIAYRDLVVPINLKGITSDQVEVRISTGFRFWEIDQVYGDFTENIPVKMQVMDPISAVDQHGNDQRYALSLDDEQYLVQPTTKDELDLYFNACHPDKGTSNHYFLFSKGYYNHIRNFQNLPEVSNIPANYQDPLFLMKFSRDKYQKIQQEVAIE